MKFIVVGSSHGGFEAVRQILMSQPDADIQWYEKTNFISFLSCGMQTYLEGIAKHVDDISYATPKGMEKQGVHVFEQQEVTKVDPKAHKVHVVNHKTGQERDESYDKLILSCGADPNKLPVPGSDLKGIYAMRGRDWAIRIKKATVNPAIHNVVVIGGGYIGIEAAEVFAKAGMHVTLIDRNQRLLGNYLDSEFTGILTKEMESHNVDVEMKQSAAKFIGKNGHVSAVKSETGRYPADLVIESAGIKPNTKWLKGVVDMTPRGLVKVNDYMQTSQPDIYCVGDATTVRFAPTGKNSRIALATNARRGGRFAVMNALGAHKKVPAVSGSSALHVFSYRFASTGIKQDTAAHFGVNAKSTFVTDLYRPHFVPDKSGNAKVYFKLTYDPKTMRILGGQVMSKMDETADINVISLAIQQHLTVNDLAYCDFFFQPGFDRPWNVLNVVAQKALRENNK
ncbi:MAG: FAD-dependent oxidoreductase [Acetilactobacillus jinshanensis]